MDERTSPAQDDAPFDINRYIERLWRFRFYIVAATLAGGAIGWVMNARVVPMHFGSARVSIAPGSGSVATASSIANLRAAVASEQVLTAAIAEAGLSGPPVNLTAAALGGAASARAESSGRDVIVELRSTDPDIGPKLVVPLARHALAVAHAQEVREADALHKRLSGELSAADKIVAAARGEWLRFRQQHPADVSQTEMEAFIVRDAKAPYLLADIRAARAKVATARDQLARTPLRVGADPNPVYEAWAGQLAASQAALSGFEAQLDFVTQYAAREASPAETAIERERDRLFGAALEAEAVRAQIVAESGRALSSSLSGRILQFVDEPAGRGTLAPPSQSRQIARGLAAGLILSVLGALLLPGLLALARRA